MKLYTINATPNRSRLEQFDDVTTTESTMIVLNRFEIDTYPKTVARVLSNFNIDGFTIYPVQGYWQGVPEVSFKIEIATDKGVYVINNIAKKLRDMYNQDSVMVTDNNNSVEFI